MTPNPLDPSAPPAPGLRERRRRELTRSIALTALELFERDGYAATTVDDIAAAAGISRTTFFRHCATKEAAVLVDDAGFEARLIQLAAEAPPRHLLRTLESEWERMTLAFDADPEGYGRFLRARRLMIDNPPLLAAGLERDARLIAQLARALASGPGLALLDARAVAESFALGMRVAFDEWVRRSEEKNAFVSLHEVYRESRIALRGALNEAGS